MGKNLKKGGSKKIGGKNLKKLCKFWVGEK